MTIDRLGGRAHLILRTDTTGADSRAERSFAGPNWDRLKELGRDADPKGLRVLPRTRGGPALATQPASGRLLALRPRGALRSQSGRGRAISQPSPA